MSAAAAGPDPVTTQSHVASWKEAVSVSGSGIVGSISQKRKTEERKLEES